MDDGRFEPVGGLYLPNHSLTESEETVPSVMGEAKLFILKRSHPAASGKKDTWTEVHGFLPIGHGKHWLDLWLEPSPTEDIGQARETMEKLLKWAGPYRRTPWRPSPSGDGAQDPTRNGR